MKKLLSVLVFFAFQPALAQTNPTASLNVYLNISSDGSATPTISGNTNLPDGTSLMVTLSGICSVAQDVVTVNHGTFKAGPFSDLGREFNSGTCDVEITSGDAIIQSAAVQAIIGSDGGNMRGPDIVENTIEPGRVLDAHREITIPQ